MPVEFTYDYSVIRIVPRVERGEQINVGVILSCVDVEFLEARIEFDTARALALDAALDVETIRAGLAGIATVCAGGPAAGPIGALSPRERFRWLVAPRSTVIQMSPVHTGRTSDPAATLGQLLDTMVRQKTVNGTSEETR